LINCIENIATKIHLLFSVHPRTERKLKDFGLWDQLKNNNSVTLTGPLSYLDFLNLVQLSKIVITDSGGIQEETTYLKIPCVTLRKNTERPITVSIGSNYLVGVSPMQITKAVDLILNGQGKQSTVPPLWDGYAGDRIIQIISSDANNKRNSVNIASSDA